METAQSGLCAVKYPRLRWKKKLGGRKASSLANCFNLSQEARALEAGSGSRDLPAEKTLKRLWNYILKSRRLFADALDLKVAWSRASQRRSSPCDAKQSRLMCGQLIKQRRARGRRPLKWTSSVQCFMLRLKHKQL